MQAKLDHARLLHCVQRLVAVTNSDGLVDDGARSRINTLSVHRHDFSKEGGGPIKREGVRLALESLRDFVKLQLPSKWHKIVHRTRFERAELEPNTKERKKGVGLK